MVLCFHSPRELRQSLIANTKEPPFLPGTRQTPRNLGLLSILITHNLSLGALCSSQTHPPFPSTHRPLHLLFPRPGIQPSDPSMADPWDHLGPHADTPFPGRPSFISLLKITFPCPYPHLLLTFHPAAGFIFLLTLKLYHLSVHICLLFASTHPP